MFNNKRIKELEAKVKKLENCGGLNQGVCLGCDGNKAYRIAKSGLDINKLAPSIGMDMHDLKKKLVQLETIQELILKHLGLEYGEQEAQPKKIVLNKVKKG